MTATTTAAANDATTTTTASPSVLDTIRLCPALGAEVRGLDLAQPLTAPQQDALRHALDAAGGLLVVRNQKLDPQAHITFSKIFGPLFGETEHLQDTVKPYLHPDFPQIYRVSNKHVNGKPAGRQRAGTYWHSDVSFRARPAMVSVLHGIEIPPLGGDTLFANMTLAYETLSDGMKAMLRPLRAVHDFASRSARGWSHERVADGDLDGANRAEHPLIRVHPQTGAASLFINPGSITHIVGFSDEESRALLDYLRDHALKPDYQYRHRWAAGDTIIWDNRCTLHYAVTDYTADRYMHRTTVIGEVPLSLQ